MRKTALYYNDVFLEHLVPIGHPENKNRIRFILDKIKKSDLKGLKINSAKPANYNILRLGHSDKYLNWLDRLKPGEEIIKIDQDTFMSKKSLHAAKIGVGCVIGAIDSILEMQNKNAFCLIRPPGHHAEREKAMGFCFLNNIAIGAKYLKEIKQIDKIAIVDFHQSNLFPFTGLENETGNTNNILNIPVNANSNSFEFRYIVDKVVIPRLKEFQPKFLIISAGFDGEKNDQMSQTQWVESDYIYITKKLKSLAKEYCDERIVSCLEGGYHLEKLASCCVSHIKALME